jgi:dipeptidase E
VRVRQWLWLAGGRTAAVVELHCPEHGLLEHAVPAIRTVLGNRGSLLFVPFASSDPDAYTTVMRQALAPAGIEVTSLHQASDLTAAVADAQAVFVGGGNSFRLLRTLTTLDVMQALRQVAETGVPYLGASAGANLACPTIRTTNDMLNRPEFRAYFLSWEGCTFHAGQV